MSLAVGDIKRHDFQADIFEMPYELVEDLGNGVWKCRRLEPDEHSLAKMAETEGDRYCDGYEALEWAMAHVGETFEIRFVSHAQWAAAF